MGYSDLVVFDVVNRLREMRDLSREEISALLTEMVNMGLLFKDEMDEILKKLEEEGEGEEEEDDYGE